MSNSFKYIARATLGMLLVIVLVPHVAGGQAPDADGDKWAPPADCNDANSDINPGRIELRGNRTDENCDGFLADADSDGYDAPADCDDSEPSVRPGAQEFPLNRTDENCDGLLADADGDGYNTYDSPGDCDDSQPNLRPGAPEYPRNVIDENCDGRLADADGDGFDAPADCDDSEPLTNPAGTEAPDNRIDENCDGNPPWPRAIAHVRLKSKTLASGATRLRSLRVTGLVAGDALRVTCRRGGCRDVIRHDASVASGRPMADLTSVVRNRRLLPRSRLRVRVRRAGYAASVFIFVMPRPPGRRPSRELRCQWPEEKALRPC